MSLDLRSTTVVAECSGPAGTPGGSANASPYHEAKGGDDGMDEDEDDGGMAAMMGFGGFGTTKVSPDSAIPVLCCDLDLLVYEGLDRCPVPSG